MLARFAPTGVVAAVKQLLAGTFNLFPLGGTNGGIAVRQKGGANGVKTYHDGTRGYVESESGQLRLISNGNSLTLGTDGTLNVTSDISIANSATFISQAAANVLKVYGVGNAPGWFQNTPGEACLNAAFTESAAALTATNLSITMKAGRSYRLEGLLIASNSTAAEGLQIDMAGGTATITAGDFFLGAQALGSVVAGALTSTTLAGVINFTTVTGTDGILLRGFIKCLAAGTLILRAAENTHAAGTLTLAKGSWLAAYDTVPL